MQAFFGWLQQNWPSVAAGIGGIYTLYKLGSIVTAIVRLIVSVTTRFQNAEHTLTLLATNHLPHLQAEMEKMNEKMESLESSQERSVDLLTEIRDDIRMVIIGKIQEHD